MRRVALVHALIGVRCPLVPDDALLIGVVGLVGAPCADDVRRDDDEGPRAVGRDLLVGATQLLVFVIEALGDELLERLADAPNPCVEALEIGGDPNLQRGLHAPTDAVHDEGHELLVVVDPKCLLEVSEVPVRAAGPLKVHLVVQPCRWIELVDDGERIVRADAIGVRDLLAAAGPDAYVRGPPARGASFFVALVVTVGGCVERDADFSQGPTAQDALPSHWLETRGHLLRWQPREPRRAQAERSLREGREAQRTVDVRWQAVGGEGDLVLVIRRRPHAVGHGDERAIAGVLCDEEGAKLAPACQFRFHKAGSRADRLVGGQVCSRGPLVCRARADDRTRIFPYAGSLLAVFSDGGERRDTHECEAHRVVRDVVVQSVESAPRGVEASVPSGGEICSRACHKGGACCPRDEDDRVVGAVERRRGCVLRLDAAAQVGGEDCALLGAALAFVACSAKDCVRAVEADHCAWLFAGVGDRDHE